jgi:hypothetical protein
MSMLCNCCVRELLILARTWFTFGLPSKKPGVTPAARPPPSLPLSMTCGAHPRVSALSHLVVPPPGARPSSRRRPGWPPQAALPPCGFKTPNGKPFPPLSPPFPPHYGDPPLMAINGALASRFLPLPSAPLPLPPYKSRSSSPLLSTARALSPSSRSLSFARTRRAQTSPELRRTAASSASSAPLFGPIPCPPRPPFAAPCPPRSPFAAPCSTEFPPRRAPPCSRALAQGRR